MITLSNNKDQKNKITFVLAHNVNKPQIFREDISQKQFTEQKQEWIPVGYVPSAAVAVSREICPGGVCQTPPVNRMTDRCKNITL